MSLLTVNDYLRAMELERQRGHRRAEKLMTPSEWGVIKDQFDEFTEKKFLTRYCQDQIYRWNRYNILHEMLPGRFGSVHDALQQRAQETIAPAPADGK